MAFPRPNPIKVLRLQRYLAACGLGSRRACEDLIRSGGVTVDGRPVIEMGVVVDPDSQSIAVRGREVHPQDTIYLALNKPPGVMCTSRDPQGRRTVLDLLPPMAARVYTVGRLDLDSEGLLLITNDGAFAHRLTHPRHHVEKVYHVWVDGPLNDDQVRRCRAGVDADGEVLRALDVKPRDGVSASACYTIVLGEGKKRHVRRMLAALGLHVKRLQRVRIGSLSLGSLAAGEHRALTPEEVESLMRAT